MFATTARALALQLLLATVAGAMQPGDHAKYEVAFQEAMRRGYPEQPGGGRVRLWNDWRSHEAPAAELARLLGSGGAEYLETIASRSIDLKEFERPGVLARMALAKLEDRTVAVAALRRLTIGANETDASMLVPVAYLPRDEARLLLEELAPRLQPAGPRRFVFLSAARLLAATGNGRSLDVLKRSLKDDDRAAAERQLPAIRGLSIGRIVPEEASSPLLLRRYIQVLETRLALAPADEAEQSRLETEYWRATHDDLGEPAAILDSTPWDIPLQGKNHRLEFPGSFLQYRLHDFMSDSTVIDTQGYCIALMMLAAAQIRARDVLMQNYARPGKD